MPDLFDALSIIVAKRFAEEQSTRREPAEDVTEPRTRPERIARREQQARDVRGAAADVNRRLGDAL